MTDRIRIIAPASTHLGRHAPGAEIAPGEHIAQRLIARGRAVPATDPAPLNRAEQKSGRGDLRPPKEDAADD